MVKMKTLTKIQNEILDFIKEKISEGIPPSLAEIADHFGYKNRATVKQHIEAIEKKGFITRQNGLSRAIKLNTSTQNFIEKPVWGEVAAGNPLTVYGNAIDTINLPKIVNLPGDSFILRVKGDSLKEAYIFNGDYIIVNPALIPDNDKIVVAIIDDAAVVKRFVKKENRIELHSENPEYKPIIITENSSVFRIIGVVVGIYRSMS